MNTIKIHGINGNIVIKSNDNHVFRFCHKFFKPSFSYQNFIKTNFHSKIINYIYLNLNDYFHHEDLNIDCRQPLYGT